MAFTYGSVVMFNASEGMQKRLLRMCRKYAKNMASEDYSEGATAGAFCWWCLLRTPVSAYSLCITP